jgi:hypothetical protein
MAPQSSHPTFIRAALRPLAAAFGSLALWEWYYNYAVQNHHEQGTVARRQGW